MASARVTIIDQRISDAHKRKLAARLRDALISPADDLRNPTQWVVIAEAVRPEDEPHRGPDRSFDSLDFAAWHAHLAGIRRWVPDGDERRHR